MVVRHERGLAHLGVGALGEQAAGAQSLPQRRLGHAVKVQVVLADELVDPSVVGAPEVAPARARHPLLVVDRDGERDGRPQRFGPAPHREPLHAVDDGSAHAPFDVAGDAEGHERLRGAEAQACRGQRVAGPIALADGGELYLEGLLVALGGTELVGRQLGGHGLVLFQVLVLYEDHGRRQKLGDGLGHHRAHLVVGLKLAHVVLQEVLEPGQIEVPVLHGAHLGDGARKRGHRGDEVHRRVLMSQIALVGIGVLRLAALHGAVALHLAAVQEGAGLSVVELQGGVQLQVTALVQALDELVGDHLVHVARVPDAAALVDVQAHLEGLKGRLLALVVGEHVVGDGARKLAGLLKLAVALVDGAAEAVGTGDETDVLGADAVAQKAREGVGGHEHAADVAEVQGLVPIGHTRRHHGAGGPLDPLSAIQVRHGSPTPSVSRKHPANLRCP